MLAGNEHGIIRAFEGEHGRFRHLLPEDVEVIDVECGITQADRGEGVQQLVLQERAQGIEFLLSTRACMPDLEFIVLRVGDQENRITHACAVALSGHCADIESSPCQESDSSPCRLQRLLARLSGRYVGLLERRFACERGLTRTARPALVVSRSKIRHDTRPTRRRTDQASALWHASHRSGSTPQRQPAC